MPARRKALCIGIDYAGTEAELRGPVHDCLRWVEVLTQHCGFRRENVMAMIDAYPSGEFVEDDDTSYSRPTQENMLEALSWFVSDVREGDVLLFTFSGHAAQVPDSFPYGGARTERLEEALCPLDWDTFEWGLQPYRLIADAVLHQFFAKLPGGVLLTAVFDACLAGAPLRVPLRIDLEYPDRETDNQPLTQEEYQDLDFDCDTWIGSQHLNALPRRLPREPSRPLWSRLSGLFARETAPPLNEGLAVFGFTAGRGAQTALEASIDGASQGVLSYCLLQALELLRYSCNYIELAEAAEHVARGLREQLMPGMDQYFQLSYGKNAGPDECRVFDPASAFAAKDRSRRRRGQRHRPV